MQFDLFEHVAGAYAQPASGRLGNAELYRIAAGRAGIAPSAVEEKAPIGKAGTMRSPLKRSLRWCQQTLRMLGVIERVPGHRGLWELTEEGKKRLRFVKDDVAVLGFSTELGVAILSNCNRVFERWDEPLFAVISSPPYPLKTPRAYGNEPVGKYIDFVCNILEPLVRNLVPGGNVVLSLSNDIFEDKSPARSLYLERLTIALSERLGLHLMDRLVWASNKPPGPIQYASKQRMQLNVGYEPLLWLCNSPKQCLADNRRVLMPHTETHKKLMERGGEQREANNGDGAHRIRPGSYGNITEGRIPKNVLQFSNCCSSQREYKRRARELGLVAHGAPMPLPLARMLVKFLTQAGQMVADMCAGSMTVPLACELENRPWVATEKVLDYVLGGAERFVDRPGYRRGLTRL